MSRNKRRIARQESQVEASDVPVETVESPRQEVKKHLRCPACWDNYGGKARRLKWRRQVNGVIHDRCYVCDQCGAEWVTRFKEEVDDDNVVWKESTLKEVRT